MRPLVGRILASFPGVVADAFSPHPVETISRPFSAALGPQVSKPTFGGTGVSDCAVRRNHLSILASRSDAALLFGRRNLVADALARDLALELGEGEQHVEREAAHAARRIERLRTNTNDTPCASKTS